MAAAFGVRRLVAAFRLKKANEKRRELAALQRLRQFAHSAHLIDLSSHICLTPWTNFSEVFSSDQSGLAQRAASLVNCVDYAGIGHSVNGVVVPVSHAKIDRD
jgi:hypothetical protein